jgi:NAD(P)-dependent dehydrogenase (short-subunit alcohol dehydrogenase family)
MIASGGGSVVLIGSQSMYEEQLPQMGYAASKGALQTAMFYLAKDLGPENIRVNMVVPSWMWGPPVQMYVEMTAKGEKVSADEVVARIAGNIPLGKIVPDEEVANAVAFFASDRARMISGQTLMVNGGEKVR